MATGPLKAAQPRRGGSWLISFALFCLAVGTVAVTVSSLSAHRGEAQAQPTTAASRIAASATPVAMRPIPAYSTVPSAPAAAPLREAKIERASAPEFKVEALPVLQADGFDTGLAPAPARQAGKSPSRRAATASPR